SHIVYQDELLAEEYARWGLPYAHTDARVIEKELQEYAECDLITVPSSFALRSFLEKGVPAEKLARLPYGVDLRLLQPVPKEDDVFRVLFVGRLGLEKGIPYLLEALAPLRLSRFELCLVGSISPEIEPFLARYEGAFRYRGVIPRGELFRCYSQASV